MFSILVGVGPTDFRLEGKCKLFKAKIVNVPMYFAFKVCVIVKYNAYFVMSGTGTIIGLLGY